jgi:hypothetical protein
MEGAVWSGATPPLPGTQGTVLDTVTHDSVLLVALTWTNRCVGRGYSPRRWRTENLLAISPQE